ncbi:hypothetical protein V8D89_013760 [Ganoderma adspersum]
MTTRRSAKSARATGGNAPSAPAAHSDSQNISPVASTSRDQVQRAALLASVTGRSFEDVKFFAFSRRTRNGSVDTPLPLLANSALIRKASSHFDFVFGAGFSESGITDMDTPYPPTRSTSAEMYDYTSDSDLEDEADVEGGAPSAHDASAEDHTDVKDNDGVSTASKEDASSDSRSLVNGSGPKRAQTRPGRVVFLGDIAYATWKSFIFYAYYEELNFSPLKSQQPPRPKEQDPYEAPLCSPKSMYRIAHKYDIASLKEKALNDIKSKLSPGNILEEMFSTFTSLYPDIQTIEYDYLHANIKDKGIQERLPTWLEAMEEGRLPKGAAGILASLISKLSFPPTLPPPATPLQPGMKKCPSGCNSTYYCQNCGHTF